MSNLNEKIAAAWAPDVDELTGQFRHYVYPDEDKEPLIAYQADVACYGFGCGIDALYSEKLAEWLPVVQAIVQSHEDLRKEFYIQGILEYLPTECPGRKELKRKLMAANKASAKLQTLLDKKTEGTK